MYYRWLYYTAIDEIRRKLTYSVVEQIVNTDMRAFGWHNFILIHLPAGKRRMLAVLTSEGKSPAKVKCAPERTNIRPPAMFNDGQGQPSIRVEWPEIFCSKYASTLLNKFVLNARQDS